MNNISKLLVFIFVIINSQILFGQDKKINDKINKSLESLKCSLNEMNYKHVKPYVDEDFVYSGVNCDATCEAVQNILETIISGYPEKLEIENIKVDKIEQDRKDYKVFTTFSYKDKDIKEEKQEILMTQEGRFFELKIPKIEIRLGSPQSLNDEKTESCKSKCKKILCCFSKS